MLLTLLYVHKLQFISNELRSSRSSCGLLLELVFLFSHQSSHFLKCHFRSFIEPAIWFKLLFFAYINGICSKKYLDAITKWNGHKLHFSNLVFHNFRMILFHHQKYFCQIYVSLHHYVSTKTFVEYLFLKYLFVSFDLLWQ